MPDKCQSSALSFRRACHEALIGNSFEDVVDGVKGLVADVIILGLPCKNEIEARIAFAVFARDVEAIIGDRMLHSRIN